ncbi:MAG: MCE family protein [Desulfuromonadales bacterium]|nr:MAG: MCE family protein [Desulfuromonadales bacterium]
MSTKVNKTAIGAFVLGAVALLVAGVLVLGAGKFFTKEFAYVTYFDGSVKGLSVGSPVMFRGVKVGSVTDISITVDQEKRQLKIPVTFTLEPEKFKGTKAAFKRDPRTIEKAVERGLRTQLQSQSFVTGQLMVALDFFPDKPANFVGLYKDYTEIPSIPTPLEQLQKTLEDLPFKEIVENLNHAIEGVGRLVNSIDGKKTMENVDAAIKDTQALVQNLNSKIGPVADNIAQAARSADAALVETKEAMVTVRSDTRKVLDSANVTLVSAQSALKQSEQTLQAYGDDSRLMTDLHKTLRELSATTRSLRQISDYLERHPESLLKGKAGE